MHGIRGNESYPFGCRLKVYKVLQKENVSFVKKNLLAETRNNKKEKNYCSLVPHVVQNLESAVFNVPKLGQVIWPLDVCPPEDKFAGGCE